MYYCSTDFTTTTCDDNNYQHRPPARAPQHHSMVTVMATIIIPRNCSSGGSSSASPLFFGIVLSCLRLRICDLGRKTRLPHNVNFISHTDNPLKKKVREAVVLFVNHKHKVTLHLYLWFNETQSSKWRQLASFLQLNYYVSKRQHSPWTGSQDMPTY